MDRKHLDKGSELRELFSRLAAGLYTAIPGVIVSFDSGTCLASVQPAIRMKSVVDSRVSLLDPPVVERVPVCLPGSATGGLFFTVPIRAGDTCLLVFGMRGIDNVVEKGGLQDPPDGAAPAFCDLRHHDLTDAICVPNLVVGPPSLTAWSATALELRNALGTLKVSVDPTTITLLNGATVITVSAAGVAITGNVVVTGEVTANGVPLSTHRHGGVSTGPNDTGVPHA